MLCHVIVNPAKSFPSVIIICINHKERSVYHTLHRKDRLACTPWFGPPGRHFITGRKVLQFLVCVLHRKEFLYSVSYDFLKIFFQISPDNEYYLIKSRFHGIVD